MTKFQKKKCLEAAEQKTSKLLVVVCCCKTVGCSIDVFFYHNDLLHGMSIVVSIISQAGRWKSIIFLGIFIIKCRNFEGQYELTKYRGQGYNPIFDSISP